MQGPPSHTCSRERARIPSEEAREGLELAQRRAVGIAAVEADLQLFLDRLLARGGYGGLHGRQLLRQFKAWALAFDHDDGGRQMPCRATEPFGDGVAGWLFEFWHMPSVFGAYAADGVRSPARADDAARRHDTTRHDTNSIASMLR